MSIESRYVGCFACGAVAKWQKERSRSSKHLEKVYCYPSMTEHHLQQNQIVSEKD